MYESVAPQANGILRLMSGKHVKSVPLAFRNRQRRVQSHPVEQIAKLAKAAADAFFDLAVMQNEALKKTA